MLEPKFQTWAFTQIFSLELTRSDHKQDPKNHPFPWKDRIRWFYLSVWYRMYCRIAYLCGDWSKSLMWKERGW